MVMMISLRILSQAWGTTLKMNIQKKKKNMPAMWETGFETWVGKTPWRKELQPTPIFLPGEFHGQRNLTGYSS